MTHQPKPARRLTRAQRIVVAKNIKRRRLARIKAKDTR